MSYHLGYVPGGAVTQREGTTVVATSLPASTDSGRITTGGSATLRLPTAEELAVFVNQRTGFQTTRPLPGSLLDQAVSYLMQLGMLATSTPTQEEFNQALINFRVMANITGGVGGALVPSDIAAMQQTLAAFQASTGGGGGGGGGTAASSSSGLPSWALPVGLAVVFLLLRKG